MSLCFSFVSLFTLLLFSRVNYIRSVRRSLAFNRCRVLYRFTIYFYGFSLSYRRAPGSVYWCHGKAEDIKTSIELPMLTKAKNFTHLFPPLFKDATFIPNDFL
jgi:hypothetical protein